eukprot:4419451-Prymnesium_polylepis.1
MRLHSGKPLLVATGGADHLEHVEAHRLGQRPALPSQDLITLLHTEGRRHVHGRVLVALLEPVVLLDVVEVVLADDDGVLHLGRLDHARDQLAPDVHAASPRALLVDIGTLDRSLRRLDAEADLLVEAGLPDARLLRAKHALLPLEDAVLLL